METRANYVLIGVFTLAVVVGVFGFVYWFQNIGGTGERAFYRVLFDGSVSGLRTGGTVLFNGIRVGEVTDLTLNPQRPQQVIATISIDKSVAVRPDTEVGLEFQGLTGIAALSLKGGSPSAPPLVGDKLNPPLLSAPPGATQDVTQAARDTHAHGSTISSRKTRNRSTARSRISTSSPPRWRAIPSASTEIAEGLQNLTGGADGKSGEINEAARSVRQMSDTAARQIDTLFIRRAQDAGNDRPGGEFDRPGGEELRPQSQPLDLGRPAAGARTETPALRRSARDNQAPATSLTRFSTHPAQRNIADRRGRQRRVEHDHLRLAGWQTCGRRTTIQ